MTTGQKVNNFVKQVLAKLTGDGNQAIALKNARKADSAVNSQLAALKAQQVDCETKVEEAEEAYLSAKYPHEPIRDNSSYVTSVKRAYENLEAAKESKESVDKSIEFFEQLSKEMNKEA